MSAISLFKKVPGILVTWPKLPPPPPNVVFTVKGFLLGLKWSLVVSEKSAIILGWLMPPKCIALKLKSVNIQVVEVSLSASLIPVVTILPTNWLSPEFSFTLKTELFIRGGSLSLTSKWNNNLTVSDATEKCWSAAVNVLS